MDVDGVNVQVPTVGDNCAVASLVNSHNGTADASGVYPQGTTMVIWTVAEIHGSRAQCPRTSTVMGLNELRVGVQLSPSMVMGTISGCISSSCGVAVLRPPPRST